MNKIVTIAIAAGCIGVSVFPIMCVGYGLTYPFVIPVYVQVGVWISWVCLIIGIVAAIILWINRRKPMEPTELSSSEILQIYSDHEEEISQLWVTMQAGNPGVKLGDAVREWLKQQ